jgi:hypothetical protein
MSEPKPKGLGKLFRKGSPKNAKSPQNTVKREKKRGKNAPTAR